MRPYFEYGLWFGALLFKKAAEKLEGPASLFRGVGRMTCEERLRELSFRLAKRRPRWLRGNLIVTYLYLKGHVLLSSKR